MTQSPLQLIRRYLALLYKYKVVEVFANPQTHRRELLFLLGVFFIVLTIIICLLLLVYFQLKTPPKIAPTSAVEISKRRKKRLAKGAVPVLAIFAILGFAGYRGTETDACKQCHVVRKQYLSWKSSSHRKVACATCHIESGATGYLFAQVNGLRNALGYIGGRYSKHLKATVTNKPCLKCHIFILNKPIVSKSIRISHKELISAGYRCTDCHTNFAHSKPSAEPKLSGMSACLPCHDNERASNRCSTCHVDQVGIAMRQLEHFQRIQLDETTLGNCRRCHTNEEKCIRCHGIELPHPAGWAPEENNLPAGENGPLLHAKASAFEKKKVCWKCHDKKLCGQCHLFPGHGPDLYNQQLKADHPVETKRFGESRCLNCHYKAKKFCILCHAKG